LINPKPKYVASRTLQGPLEQNATVLEGDATDAVSLATVLVDELRFWFILGRKVVSVAAFANRCGLIGLGSGDIETKGCEHASATEAETVGELHPSICRRWASSPPSQSTASSKIQTNCCPHSKHRGSCTRKCDSNTSSRSTSRPSS
jgi:hypothetical protein